MKAMLKVDQVGGGAIVPGHPLKHYLYLLSTEIECKYQFGLMLEIRPSTSMAYTIAISFKYQDSESSCCLRNNKSREALGIVI